MHVAGAETAAPDWRDPLLLLDEGMTAVAPIGPGSLFGIGIECAMNGSSAEVQITANKQGRHYLLLREAFLDPVAARVQITIAAGRYASEMQDGRGEDLTLSKPFEVLEALALGDGRVTVVLTNKSGQKLTETFISGNWAG